MTLGCCVCVAQLEPARHGLREPLSANDRELFDQAMGLMDASYDAPTHLLRRPSDVHGPTADRYMVRESSWYALGLLMRDRAGDHPEDAQRAIETLGAVLDQQYLDKQKKWYGTFKRDPMDPLPQVGATAFTTYDPNWRHFVGTTLQSILIEYPERVPAALQARMYSAIDAAVEGEMRDGRLLPSYSNIALMYGALWDFAAVHDKNAEWARLSAAWTEEVHRLFQQYGTFNEYNAPTYYGVDLYGLALWRDYGSTARMRQMGSEMEAGLWNAIAEFYHPGLRNIAGPYDRSYGMDMTTYVTPTGVWIRSVLSAAEAPLPAHPTLATYQVADLWYAPQVALLGTRVPPAAMARLRKFDGPKLIVEPIDSQRTASAWMGATATWGGEFTSRTKDTGNKTQFHPVAANWRMPSGAIGWIRLTKSPDIDAIADRDGVTIATDGDVTFRIFAGGEKSILTQSAWTLPGFNASIETDAHGFSTSQPADCDGCTDVTYTATRSLRLNLGTALAPQSPQTAEPAR